MIRSVIQWSGHNRLLVLLATALFAVWGVFALIRTPLDAIPDLSDTQVIIRTSWPGQAPQLVENQLTYPLTTTMLSVPGVKAVRGYSFFGDSFVYIIFNDDTDLYWARSRVLEYLNQVSGRLPKGAVPSLGPVVGGTGYTGVELLRLLAQHPDVELSAITSRSEAGMPVAEMFPNLRGHVDLAFSEPSIEALGACDVVFFATPHGVAMKQAPELLARGVKIIDLGADFRLADAAVFEKWYGIPHGCTDILAGAVYGLPEMNRAAIKKARLIANPGCYPTAVQLGFLPLLKAGMVDAAHLVADAKSGVSGAGRKAEVHTLFSETAESFRAYGVAGHRHLPEISQGLNAMTQGKIGLTFVPHLLPMIRGIHATLYARLTNDGTDLQKLYEEAFAEEPFVDVMPAGSLPETRSVKGANTCRIAVYRPQGGDTVVVLSVIDNLVKGAAGQAVQNMNIMFDLPETAGLTHIALLP